MSVVDALEAGAATVAAGLLVVGGAAGFIGLWTWTLTTLVDADPFGLYGLPALLYFLLAFVPPLFLAGVVLEALEAVGVVTDGE